MLTIIALIIGFVAGYLTESHYSSKISDLETKLSADLKAIKEKMGL